MCRPGQVGCHIILWNALSSYYGYLWTFYTKCLCEIISVIIIIASYLPLNSAPQSWTHWLCGLLLVALCCCPPCVCLILLKQLETSTQQSQNWPCSNQQKICPVPMLMLFRNVSRKDQDHKSTIHVLNHNLFHSLMATLGFHFLCSDLPLDERYWSTNGMYKMSFGKGSHRFLRQIHSPWSYYVKFQHKGVRGCLFKVWVFGWLPYLWPNMCNSSSVKMLSAPSVAVESFIKSDPADDDDDSGGIMIKHKQIKLAMHFVLGPVLINISMAKFIWHVFDEWDW